MFGNVSVAETNIVQLSKNLVDKLEVKEEEAVTLARFLIEKVELNTTQIQFNPLLSSSNTAIISTIQKLIGSDYKLITASEQNTVLTNFKSLIQGKLTEMVEYLLIYIEENKNIDDSELTVDEFREYLETLNLYKNESDFNCLSLYFLHMNNNSSWKIKVKDFMDYFCVG
jgi:hypothetical protein